MASGKRLGRWFVVIGLGLGLQVAMAACKFPELADLPADAEPDAPLADAAIDGAQIDGAEIDGAEIDSAEIDSAETDAAVDAPIDAPWVLNGRYLLTTTPSYVCAGGLLNINFTSLMFSTMAGMLRAQADTNDQQPCLMTGPSPTGTSFSLSCSITGTCTENYALTGTITGATTFMGTFTASFVGGVNCMGCTNRSFNVAGTLM